MKVKVHKVVWTLQARESLHAILDYRYSKIPAARKIIRKDIIDASKDILFVDQFQSDEISPEYRRIIVRDYKLIYKAEKSIIYILNVVCTKAEKEKSP
jgi:plasmid stabilization system protein ParE